MNDYTVSELMEHIRIFCEERDWDQFHNPKDLAIGISTEAGELLDLFRFIPEEEAKQLVNGAKRERVEEELADILFFLLRFAALNNMDLKDILEKKIAKNALKYPVDKAKGSNKKYDEF